MTIKDFIRDLAQHDFAVWSRADLDRALAEGSWETCEYDSGSLKADRDGWCWMASGCAQWEREYFGEFKKLTVKRRVAASRVAASTTGEEYRQLLAAAVEVLGPPGIVGGPDAVARWRRPDVTMTVSRRIFCGKGEVKLSIVPTEPTEDNEYLMARGDPTYEPSEHWYVRPVPGSANDKALNGMMFYPHPSVADWAELRERLRTLFGSLAADLPVLRPYVSDIVWVLAHLNGDWLAQGWFNPDEVHLELAPSGTKLDLPPGLDNGVQVAEATVEALRTAAGSPSELRYEAFATGRQIAYLDGFGLTHVENRSETPPDRT